MLKMCDKTLSYPLQPIASFEEGVFSDCLKIANVVPTHKWK